MQTETEQSLQDTQQIEAMTGDEHAGACRSVYRRRVPPSRPGLRLPVDSWVPSTDAVKRRRIGRPLRRRSNACLDFVRHRSDGRSGSLRCITVPFERDRTGRSIRSVERRPTFRSLERFRNAPGRRGRVLNRRILPRSAPFRLPQPWSRLTHDSL